MVSVYVRTGKEGEVANSVIERLRRFSQFDDSHSVLVHQNRDGFSIAYWTAEKRTIFEQTQFNIQTKGEIGYVLDIFIAQPRQGFGRELYGCVEDIFRDLSIFKIRTTPSGQGIYFWPKMGFNPINAVELEKVLS